VTVDLLELAAAALDDLLEEVVFVGGATVVLWITDSAAPPPRPTKDVDVIVEVTTRGGFYAFEGRLRDHGFKEDQESGVICRWQHRDTGLVLDAMPANASILGFENRWQAEALPFAEECELPNGSRIRVVPPTYLLATKLEAFKGRGKGDFLGSADFADIVALVDGREELVPEVQRAASELRRYVSEELQRLRSHPRFLDGIYSAFPPDLASQARADEVVLPRLELLVVRPR
jgi:Nucleotidyl transferase AbiEii toxin, Type IV TA system